MNKPLVSIIVPVYNSEKYLHRCLDSLIGQSLNEIEIIVVDNGSTDDSANIIKKYIEIASDKIKYILTPHRDYAGAGRNTGLDYATGEYIGFCDSDDYMSLNAVEKMYNKAVATDSDIVFTSFYIVKDNKVTISSNFSENVSREALIMYGSVSLWNKLFKKSFINEYRMPEEHGYEDLGFLPTLMSFATKVSYLKNPTYYYIIRENSEVNSQKNPKNLHILLSVNDHMSNINLVYYEQVLFANVRRMVGDIQERWVFSDYFIEYLKSNKKSIFSSKLICNSNIGGKAKFYINQTPDSAIPKTVFLNGFSYKYTNEEISNLTQQVFYPECSVVVLDESNCDINSSDSFIQDEYKKKNYKIVAEYFAAKSIYENGGVFIDKTLVIDTFFNNVRYTSSFFSFEDNNTISDLIFGAQKENIFFGKLLKTYKLNSYNSRSLSIGQRAKVILSVEDNIKMDGKTNRYAYSSSIFSADVFLVDLPNKSKRSVHMSHIQPKISNISDEKYVIIPISICKNMVLNPNSNRVVKKIEKNINLDIKPMLQKILGKKLYNFFDKIIFPYGSRRRIWLKKRIGMGA